MQIKVSEENDSPVEFMGCKNVIVYGFFASEGEIEMIFSSELEDNITYRMCCTVHIKLD